MASVFPQSGFQSQDDFNFEVVAFPMGQKTNRETIHTQIYNAENLFRHAEIYYHDHDIKGMRYLLADLQNLADEIGPQLVKDEEHTRLSAALGMSYALHADLNLNHDKVTSRDARIKAVQYLSDTLQGEYKHPADLKIRHELYLQANRSGKHLKTGDSLEMCLKHFNIAAEMLESIIARDIHPGYPNAREHCAEIYADIAFVYKRMNLKKERILPLKRAVELYDEAVNYSEGRNTNTLIHKKAQLMNILASVFKDISGKQTPPNTESA